MKKRLERRREQLEEKNARMFGKMERCISISELSAKEQDGCFEELLDELEAVQAKHDSYRSFTGGSLENYCRKLMRRHSADCQPQHWAQHVLYVFGMALVAGFLIALVERIGWKRGNLFSQQISIWLVYGMALTEQLVDHLLRNYIQRSVFRGRDWPYEHRSVLEWLVLISCYGIFGGIVFLSPLYHVVTSLPRMLWLLVLGVAVYGLCLAAVRVQEQWMPFLYRLQEKRSTAIWVNLAVLLLIIGAAAVTYQYLLGTNAVVCSILIVGLLFYGCIAANLRELLRKN